MKNEKMLNKKLFLILTLLVLLILIYPVELGGQCFQWDSILFHFRDYRNGCYILPYSHSVAIPGYVIDIDPNLRTLIGFSSLQHWTIIWPWERGND